MNRYTILGLLAAGALALVGCDLDLEDPNLPTEDTALGTREGVTRVAIGLQAEYSGQLVDPIYVIGMVTDEIGTFAEGTFESYQRLDRGDPIDYETGPAEAPWGGQYRVIKLANDLLRVTPSVGFGPGTTSGIMALARLYKAMALGNLAAIYPSLPLDVGDQYAHPPFVPRDSVLQVVVSLLQQARDGLQATPPSAEFTSTIPAPGFDLANTIEAMLARYALVAGDDALAYTAAGRVDAGVLSEFRFSTSDANPLYGMWYASGNAYRMRADERFRTEAEAGDQRVAYWVEATDLAAGAEGPLDDLARFRTASDPIAAYLPDEMRLILAEVHARAGELDQAITLINAVRTQCSSALDEPVACLPALTSVDLPTQEAVLAEILRQRRYELYLQGVRWDDYRRFGAATKYDFMPWPRAECDNNTSAPC